MSDKSVVLDIGTAEQLFPSVPRRELTTVVVLQGGLKDTFKVNFPCMNLRFLVAVLRFNKQLKAICKNKILSYQYIIESQQRYPGVISTPLMDIGVKGTTSIPFSQFPHHDRMSIRHDVGILCGQG